MTEVDIPLEVQEQRLRSQWQKNLRIMRDFINSALEDPDSGLRDLALKRLRDGHATYGSRMYGWGWKERRQNFLEELADAPVYLSSGPIA